MNIFAYASLLHKESFEIYTLFCVHLFTDKCRLSGFITDLFSKLNFGNSENSYIVLFFLLRSHWYQPQTRLILTLKISILKTLNQIVKITSGSYLYQTESKQILRKLSLFLKLMKEVKRT